MARKQVKDYTIRAPKFMKVKQFFLLYPYKKNTEVLNHRPYIKKKDVSDHKYTVNILQFKRIFSVLFKVIWDRLWEGNIIELPYEMGVLQMTKSRRRRVDFVKSKALERVIFHKRLNTQGYSPRITWIVKGKNSKFAYSRAIVLKYSTLGNEDVAKKMKNTPNILSRFNDESANKKSKW